MTLRLGSDLGFASKVVLSRGEALKKAEVKWAVDNEVCKRKPEKKKPTVASPMAEEASFYVKPCPVSEPAARHYSAN